MSSTPVYSQDQESHLDLIFQALSDRTRRAMLARLTEGSAMFTELARPFDMSLPAVGKHLKVLEKAGLVKRAVNGRVHRCTLDARPLRDADDWLAHYQAFWQGNLDSLTHYLKINSD